MHDGITLLIATHTHGYVTPAYAAALATATAYLAAHGVPHSVAMFEDSLVCRGRNRAAHEAMTRDFSHLLFIDADIQFKPEDIIRLLALDKDVAVGAYRKKNDRDEFAMSWLPDASRHLEQCAETGAVKIANAGTGFMLIKSSVFQALADAMPDIAYDDLSPIAPAKVMHAFFEVEVRDRRQWSEDFVFCERWRAIGGEVWLHPEITLSHWGPHAWRGSILDVLQPAKDADHA
jgi:glycosyltransferase involved in cell wall biosynthesis